MLNHALIKEEFADSLKASYLNISSISIPPKSVQQAYTGYFNDYIQNFAHRLIPYSWEIVEEARANISALIGAKPAEIGFVKNTSEGIGIIANGLPLSSGDNVIIVDQEHQATLFAWIAAQKRGIELRVVPSTKDDIELSQITDRMDSCTKAVIISAVQFSTGIRTDLRTLGSICKEKGILFIVDGIQAVGRLQIDVNEMNIDYLACGGHKGLLGVMGVGFVYCREDLISQIIPPYACYQSVKAPKDAALTASFDALDWHDDSRRFESGNLNYAGVAAINAGAKLLLSLGVSNIEEHILSLETKAISYLRQSGIEVVCPKEPEKRSGIFCVAYPKEIEPALKKAVIKHEVYLTFRGDVMRIGIGCYNDMSHIEKLCDAIKEVMQA